MAAKDDKKRQDYLSWEDGTDVPASDEEISLEEILSEYGKGLKNKLLEEEPPAPPEETRRASPEEPPKKTLKKGPKRERTEALPDLPETEENVPDAPAEEILPQDLPPAPRPVSLEDVVGSTVDAVMEETQEPLLEPRRGLFSRRRMPETETLYEAPEPKKKAEPKAEVEEIVGPEPEAGETAEEYRKEYRRRRRLFPAAVAVSLLVAALTAVDGYGVTIPLWTGEPMLQSLILLGFLVVMSLLAKDVFLRAAHMLKSRWCTCEVLMCLCVLASAADCLMRILQPARSDAMPYAAVSCVAMTFALWGDLSEKRALYDTFRTVAMDEEPPYCVTETERGACKRAGTARGFYTTAMRRDLPAVWQAVLLPVIFVASLVFAGLSSLGQGRGADFFLNWSAILAAGATFALPLCWALPWSHLAKHLRDVGCAVAGWRGAEKISRNRAMILTDGDLFPPGTVQLNGVKVFGEELPKVTSYAASMARSAGSGLQRLFSGLMFSESGDYEEISQFSFYEEGGYSATIHGESVLLGTSVFMRKMDVRLPGNIKLRTGVFLAVDGQLAAVFAVKYNPAANVDLALRMLRRSRTTPILAVRDPNITPALLKRKFYKGFKAEYPDLSERVALSELQQDRSLPRALLLREGLLPYAETAVGSRRLCKAAREAAVLSLLSSIVGTLLAFYLVFQKAYGLLTPTSLLAFLLLWVFPVLLLTGWTGKG